MSALSRHTPNQQNPWTGDGGAGWVECQPILDQAFRPHERDLICAALEEGACNLLDIGCGAGGVTLAVARALGPHARCTGIDISQPLVRAAQWQAQEQRIDASFIEADAERHPLPTGAFDMLISRFGVMFFENSVAAFKNLRRSAQPGARLLFHCWRRPDENSFMTAAEKAVRPLLPELPHRQDDAPGQFGFADGYRVGAILEQSGWREIAIEKMSTPCAFPVEHLELYVTRLGPVGRLLSKVDAERRGAIQEAALNALKPFVSGEEVCFTAECWRVSARA